MASLEFVSSCFPPCCPQHLLGSAGPLLVLTALQFSSGNTNSIFALDYISGALTLNGPLDRENPFYSAGFILTVKVRLPPASKQIARAGWAALQTWDVLFSWAARAVMCWPSETFNILLNPRLAAQNVIHSIELYEGICAVLPEAVSAGSIQIPQGCVQHQTHTQAPELCLIWPVFPLLPTRTLDEHDICCNRARSLPARHREGVMLEVLPCQEKALERGFPAPAAPPESGSLALLTAL